MLCKAAEMRGCMNRFSDIVGQEQLKEHLENAIKMNKVSHAYIINGEKNAGKEFIAKTFAMAARRIVPDSTPFWGETSRTLFLSAMKNQGPSAWMISGLR